MNGRILVVDDAPANIQALASTLKEKSCQISVATNGKEALEVVSRVHADLVVLDAMMPEMDGFETCRRLKASDATRDIPVVFRTARTETEDIIKCLKLGAVDYVPKPFNHDSAAVSPRARPGTCWLGHRSGTSDSPADRR
jgi:CheY-like chemotaxis protein